jgi:hypothetical protein
MIGENKNEKKYDGSHRERINYFAEANTACNSASHKGRNDPGFPHTTRASRFNNSAAQSAA